MQNDAQHSVAIETKWREQRMPNSMHKQNLIIPNDKNDKNVKFKCNQFTSIY